MLFQNIHSDGFDVWFSNYFIKVQSSFSCFANVVSLELHTMLKNDWDTDMEGLGKVNIKQNQFNMTYLPFVNCTTYFEAGDYTSFDIHYSPTYLEKYVFMLPILEPFLKNIKKGIACHLLPAHAFSTPEMIAVINQVLNSGYNDALQKVYFDIKASELLFLALRRVDAQPGSNGITINPGDIEKMYAAKSWLEENIYSPLTLPEIARTVGTNEFKLKKGFKELFGVTVFDYLLKIRMERARQFLMETSKPITEIAYLTGYSSHSSFTNAFTKHFGYAPKYLRKADNLS